ncbi:MAG: apolipoprotein N-acyltransferase [Candidatus Lambdaproteobacteria bacterium]|nr:apolipoprotein N-acyltransferase [Candidatus Lambdaproteobacteria bacterium]
MPRSSNPSRPGTPPGRPARAPGVTAPAGAAAAGGRVPPRVRRRAVPALVALSGVLLGLAIPGRGTGWVWPVVFVPLLVALDWTLDAEGAGPASGGWRRPAWRDWGRLGWRALACAWPVGVLMAALSGGWVVNTAHVYGRLPLVLAHGVNLLGYGTLVGLEVFLFLALPFAVGRTRPRWGFALVTLWSAVAQAFTPRFISWSYGQMMYPLAALVQAADVLGSPGLNLLYVPLQLLLFGWLRAGYRPGSAPGNVPRRALAWASAALAIAFAAAFAYGQWRQADVARAEAVGAPVQLVGVQPDFSLRRLASNPDLAISTREASLDDLLADSERGLQALARRPEVPVVVVWPESVYPEPFLYAPRERARVEAWLRGRGVQLVLATTDFAWAPGTAPGTLRPQGIYGAAVHLGPEGRVLGVYHKLTLIPFGETIPFASWFPAWRAALKAWIPQIGEFEAGTRYAVFPVSDRVRLAPMICFDATVFHVARGMADAGANLGLVLANLAWFGRTSVADQFAAFVRFRAIENRIPILLLSQNGRSLLFDARGEVASPVLGQFEAARLALDVRVPATGSVYRRWGPWIERGYALLLAAVLVWGWWGRRPAPPAAEARARAKAA